jgi:hypothetical protein
MAKDKIFNDDPSGIGANKDNWAGNIKRYRDPVSGAVVNSIGDSRPESQVRPSPAGSGLNKPSDSNA